MSSMYILPLISLIAGFGKNRLGRRKRVAGKKRPYSVKTGLAAKKALGSRKGISPLNRPPLSEKVCVGMGDILFGLSSVFSNGSILFCLVL